MDGTSVRRRAGARMSDDELGSVTRWLDLLRHGDKDAARAIFDRFFPRLVARARARLRGAPSGLADGEDVALSAFDSVLRRAAAGGFAELGDRDDLWQVLMLVTARKAIDLVHHERRPRRGGGRVGSLDGERDAGGHDDPGDTAPGPDLAAQLAEDYRLMLDRLGDDTLRLVAERKLEGDTHAEIAARLGCSTKTVDRKVRAIRRLWSGVEPDA